MRKSLNAWVSKVHPSNDTVCSPDAALFAGCMTGKMFKSCPSPSNSDDTKTTSNNEDTDKKCGEISKFIDKCGFVLPYEAPL